MIQHRIFLPGNKLASGPLRLVLAFAVFSSLFGLSGQEAGQRNPTAAAAPLHSTADSDMFGMVIRDPFYEYNTDPVNFKNAPNRTALERMAMELHAAGV